MPTPVASRDLLSVDAEGNVLPALVNGFPVKINGTPLTGVGIFEPIVTSGSSLWTLQKTLTNTDINCLSGINNVYNIPITAIQGYQYSTLTLTNPGADRIPFWDFSANSFDWMDPASLGGGTSVYTALDFTGASLIPMLGTSAVRGIAKDVYIAVRTDGKNGTGTAEDPFAVYGATDLIKAGKFDSLVASLPVNTHVHLAPDSTFPTVTGIVLTNVNITISGGGIDSTIIKYLDQGSTSANHDVIRQNGPCTNIRIRDLTVNCNLEAQSAANCSIGAVQLIGTDDNGGHCFVERVKATHFGVKGNGSTGECFVFISYCSNATQWWTAPWFIDCEVTTPAALVHGYTVTAFDVGGGDTPVSLTDTTTRGWAHGGGLLRCKVHDITVGSGSGQVPALNCFTPFSSDGLIFEDNRCWNVPGASGIYSDTGPVRNFTAKGNDLIASQPVFFNTPANCGPLYFYDNNLHQLAGAGGNAAMAIIGQDTSHRVDGLVIRGGNINSPDSYGVQISNTNNYRLENLVVDSTNGFSFSGNAGAQINRNNKTSAGVIVGTATPLTIAEGGTNSGTASGARTSLGATTSGASVFTCADPGAGTFMVELVNNAAVTRTPAQFLNDISGTGFTGAFDNFTLPITTSSVGQVKQNGARLFHTYGTDNVFLGSSAGNFTASGSGRNIGIGTSVFQALTTGTNNVASGYNAGIAITSGSNNIALSANSLLSLTTGSRNIALGDSALSAITTLNDNTAVGWSALSVATSGRNTAVGSQALLAATGSGTPGNVAIGFNSLVGLTTGAQDTGVGYGTGATDATGNHNTFLGYGADVTTDGLSYATAIGAGATVSTSNTVTLGRSSDTVKIPGTLVLGSNTVTISHNITLDTDGTGTRTLNIGAGGTLGTAAFTAASAYAASGANSDVTSMSGLTGTVGSATGYKVRDTSAAFDVTLAATSSTTLTAGRTLTLDMGNVAHTLAFGTTAGTITFPNTAADTVAMLGVANAFTAAQSVTTSNALAQTNTVTGLGTTTLPGLLVTNTTAAAAGAQQYSPSVRWTGQGWKTTATAASQAVDFRAYVVPVQGTTNPTAYWTLESAINGGSFGTPLNWTSGGLLQFGGTSSSLPAIGSVSAFSTTRLSVRLADNSDWANLAAAGVECLTGVNRFLLVSNNLGSGRMGMGMSSDSRIYWASTSSSSDTNIGVNGDTGIGRNAAGVIEINSAAAGTYRDLKLRTLIADSTVTGAGTTGAQTINKSRGTVRFAAAATTLVVTDSLVVSTSKLRAFPVGAFDATATNFTCTAASGSFTITANAAATAETEVAFDLFIP